ncbi:ChrB domain-containing protein [Deinococcus saxicola]|uniref:Chromate resistance protein ChrB n=1 Tax=Deinococcus saxicola TaxID=249406 RepID=UPI0039F0DE24
MNGWLLIYKVPKEPSTARVTIWRRTRHLGALYLQQSACYLPDRGEHRQVLEAVAAEVRAFGGEAHVLGVVAEGEERERLLRRLEDERGAEYAEVHEQIALLHSELHKETQAGKFTFAELEDMESALERLHTWLVRVEARDIEGSTGYQAAALALAEVTEAVGAFAQAVYQHEAGVLRLHGGDDE